MISESGREKIGNEEIRSNLSTASTTQSFKRGKDKNLFPNGKIGETKVIVFTLGRDPMISVLAIFPVAMIKHPM